MDVQAFQCVYKGLKLIIEDLGYYLRMKKRDCFGNKQNTFLLQFLCMFSYGKLHGIGTNEFGKLWEEFWQVLNVEEREKSDLKSQSIFQACVKLNFPFMLFTFLAS